jgi:TonB-dependent receptor
MNFKITSSFHSHRYLWSFLLTIISFSSFGQSGFVSGKILSDTKETLPGATIRLVGSVYQGGVTDIDGNFQIINIPIGEKQFEVSFIGYKKQILTTQVTEGNNDLGLILLESDIFIGEDVIVTAQVHGQQTAINQQLASDAMVNIISADKIQELPDVNAAEAIGRLPGVALDRSGGEGQKVIIRGLEPKYAAITLNGVRLPSNSSSDRSVDLSLISPEMLSGIEVYKNPLPNMDAESTAGSVNLTLRKAPDNLRLMARGLGGYNQINDYYKDYKGVFQFSNRTKNKKLGYSLQTTAERFNRGGEQLSYGFAIDEFRYIPLGEDDSVQTVKNFQSSSLSLRDVQEIRKRYNTSVSLDYDFENAHSISLFGLYSRREIDKNVNSAEFNPGNPSIKYNSDITDNVLDLYSLSLSGQHGLGILSMDWSLSQNASKGSTPFNFAAEFDTRIGTVPLYDFASTGVDRYADHPENFLIAAQESDLVALTESSWSETSTQEQSRTALINFKLPFQVTDKIGAELQFGGKYFSLDRDRTFDEFAERFFYLGGGNTQPYIDNYNDLSDQELITLNLAGGLISYENFVNEDYKPDVELRNGDTYVFSRAPDPDALKRWSSIQRDNYTERKLDWHDNRYSVHESVSAFYTMLKLNVGESFTIIPGVRYEYSDNSYDGLITNTNGRGVYGQAGIFKDSTSTQKYGKFFPHLHAKYQPLDILELRFSYARTISRPNYTSLIPRADIDDNNNRISAGNPMLKPMISDNYDLSAAIFHRAWGLFTVGAFYKQIGNLTVSQSNQLIDQEFAAEYGWPDYPGYLLSRDENIDNTKVYGYEFDLQTNLASLPAPFNGVVISVNYARLYSETQVFFLNSSTTFSGFPPVPVTVYETFNRKVSMPSQAPHVFRASLGYDYKGFSARVSASYQGTRLRGFSSTRGADTYNQAFWRVDATIKQHFNKNWSAFINLNNLSNQRDVNLRYNDFKVPYDYQSFGPTGQIGIEFKLRKDT